MAFKSTTFKVNKPRKNNITGGGAIYFFKDTSLILIDNCEFDNITARTGGAIYAERDLSLSIINNTKFINNKACTGNLKYGGGAITLEKDASSIYICNSEFINNTATTHGGAIMFMGNDENNAFVNCTFVDNYAPYGGSIGLVNNSKCLNITDCYFEFTGDVESPLEVIGGGALYFINDADDLIIENSTFYGLTARTAGAVYVEGDLNTAVINGSAFIGNKATTNNTKYGGGAIAVEGNVNILVIDESIFINNSATTHGGAIKLMANNSYISISNSKFDSNYAPYGGAIALGNTELLGISKSNFTNHKGINQDIVGGGVIYVIGNLTYTDIMDSLFVDNSARAGGAIYVENNVNLSTFYSNYFINNSAFTNNTRYGGGAIAIEGNATSISIFDNKFINNTATTHGGAIMFRENNEFNKFINCNFVDNYAPYGGSISSVNNSIYLNLTDCIFAFNEDVQSPLEIIGGGALYFINDADDLVIESSSFYGLTARAGGAVYVEGDLNTAIIDGTEFIGNKATTNNTKYGGGAIAVEGNASMFVITESIFINNSATTHGGAIKLMGNNSNISISKSGFDSNYAPYGGAIALGNTEALVIYKSNFTNHMGTDEDIVGGGAIYVIGNLAYAEIMDSLFADNSACAAGAVYVEGNLNTAVINGTDFIGNKATTKNTKYGGGAIAVEGNASMFMITESNFINNSATTCGGAIYINDYAKDFLIDDSLFSGNNADSAKAIYLNDGDNVCIQNSRFINNNGSDGDILFKGKITASVINSSFEGERLIKICENASVLLSDNIELSSIFGDYFVYNEGVLALENNSLSKMIFNIGEITSPTTMMILFNETYNNTEGIQLLHAICHDDNYNLILSEYGTFYLNDKSFKAFYNDMYTLTYYMNLDLYGTYLVNATMYGLLSNCTYKYGIINFIPLKEANMNVSDFELECGKYGEIEVMLPEDATGFVYASINDESYVAQVNNGKATVIIPPLEAGEYSFVFDYSGDYYYNGDEIDCTVNVKDKIKVDAPDVTKYYHGQERFVVNVTQSGEPIANASVIISINGQTYARTTDEKGIASIALGLSSGNYTATVRVDDIKVDSNVVVLPTVNGTDITKIYRNGTQYYATFFDSEGNYLKEGTTVTFNINGVFYSHSVSGNKGLAKLNINLNPGEYIITAINPNTGERASNVITVVSRFIENKDITKYFRNGTQYTVKVLDDKGNVVGAGQTVTFNINGVLYERKTDASGIATLNINLQPGDYIITAEYKQSKVSNNIKVLPVLTADDLTKQYGTGDQFEAKLVDGQGRPYAEQKVGFNINGVFYYRVTDSSGIAKLSINLIPGEYIITSSYGYATISNKITIVG